MLEIKGKVNTAICYAKVIDEGAIDQIQRMCDYNLTEGCKVRIMPDVHQGKGCTIGRLRIRFVLTLLELILAVECTL